MYKTDPLTGIRIVYDKRIRVGDLRLDRSRKFLRMNPKTKPTLDRAVAYTNAQDLFSYMSMRGCYSPQLLANPPIILNAAVES